MQIRNVPRGCTFCGYPNVTGRQTGQQIVWTCPKCGNVVARAATDIQTAKK